MKTNRGGSWALISTLLLACGGGAGPESTTVGNGGASNQGGSGSGSSNGGDGSGGFGSQTLQSNGGTFFEVGGAAGATSTPGAPVDVVSMRIDPADAVLNARRGEAQSRTFTVYGKLSTAPDEEVDLTESSVLFVPDGYLVGGFPADGANTFSVRLPGAPEDLPQRGGRVTVEARAANSDGSLATATTTLTVRLQDDVSAEAGSAEATPALPAAPEAHFVGSADPAFAPQLFYPNDGVLLPPNLGTLEVHFLPGSNENSLFRVRFEAPSLDISHYARCYSDPTEFVDGACALTVTGEAFEHLASSAQGLGPVTVTVEASDEDGHFGRSDSLHIEFAENRIDGAVYYWTATSPASIVRVDFGSGQSAPETFLSPSSVPGNDGSCVGCHALSRQGDKMLFGLGNSADGQLMYIGDMSLPDSDPDYFTYNGALTDQGEATADQTNRLLTASFSPDGDAFVAAAPVNDPESDQQLFFHDGTTGERNGFVALPFTPSHPDWSPLGDTIAVTRIDGANSTSIEFLGGGISLVTRDGDTWLGNSPVNLVPSESGKSRYNPAFFPDGSLLLYSEVDQSSYSGSHATSCDAASVGEGHFCNGYSDPGAKTWAVAPSPGATPVLLANAAAPGLADAVYPPPQSDVDGASLMDTFPKPAPFLIEHRGLEIGWFTVSSQRRAGLRRFTPNASVVGDPATQALLWMFALDPARVAAGQDGSSPGFFLPFQDLSTSNHMAQWAARIVSDVPPPAPPPVPPAPDQPPPPPPIVPR